MVNRTLALVIALVGLPLLGSKCGEGNGLSGSPPQRIARSEGECVPIPNKYPPGFAWLPGDAGHVVAVSDGLPGALFFDMNGDRPESLARGESETIPPDSDGDGFVDEDQRLCDSDTKSKFVVLGKPLGVSEELAFIAGSGYEQVMFVSAPNGELARFEVTNPPDTLSGSYHGEDYPYLPETHGLRTAISTKACIYLTDGPGLASDGVEVQSDPCCDRLPNMPSFFTAFTAGLVLAAGHLYVATSNLDLDNSQLGRFFPGTVLVYDFDPLADPPTLQPNVDTPVLFTTGFNPTGVSRYLTPRGRELVFITNTGALRPAVGRENILTQAYIDVIDAASQRIVATIPMGFAGLSFDGLAIDPAQRVGLIGSWNLPVLYAIDLRAFDDESLYQQSEIIRLDGSDPQFSDARIFDAEHPFEIPDRQDGPHPILCEGWTFVAINEAGESAYVLEQCDGTLTQVNLLDPELSCEAAGGSGVCCDRVPLPRSCFSLGAIQNLTEPFNTVTPFDHAPSQIGIRPGEPGIDYTGPDVFYAVDLPDGKLCPLYIDSF